LLVLPLLGVWNGVWGVTGGWRGVGTLLGPEATRVSVCLGDRPPWWANRRCSIGVRGCGGCGVVFENCIVDASILMT
jgi:hypothetical protein